MPTSPVILGYWYIDHFRYINCFQQGFNLFRILAAQDFSTNYFGSLCFCFYHLFWGLQSPQTLFFSLFWEMHFLMQQQSSFLFFRGLVPFLFEDTWIKIKLSFHWVITTVNKEHLSLPYFFIPPLNLVFCVLKRKNFLTETILLSTRNTVLNSLIREMHLERSVHFFPLFSRSLQKLFLFKY